MRLVLQRVARASVRVGDEEVAAIGRGLLVLVGVERGDTRAQVAAAARKLGGLRLFEDGQGKMNLDLTAAGGAVLLVSQFTLAGSLARGRRPSFDGAAPPEAAEPLVAALASALAEQGVPVATGRFRAHMAVELVNDGPVTFVLEIPPELR
jgi:D-aminoacyl-tRNA deacylase